MSLLVACLHVSKPYTSLFMACLHASKPYISLVMTCLHASKLERTSYRSIIDTVMSHMGLG